MPSSIEAPGDNFVNPDDIRRDAANAEFTLFCSDWLIRHWDTLPVLHQSALQYGLRHYPDFGAEATLTFNVPLLPLLEVIVSKAVRASD
jgi:hypothetical protein